MLLQHYLYRLSTVLTLEPQRDNAYRTLLLPKALQHQGLMHSILALAGKHIHYNDPSGASLLLEYPDLPARIEHHAQRANALLNADIDSGNAHSMTLAANIGQILCKVLECLADGRTTNEHRIHLECYQRLIREVQPQDREFMGFVSEFFDYHVSHTILSSYSFYLFLDVVSDPALPRSSCLLMHCLDNGRQSVTPTSTQSHRYLHQSYDLSRLCLSGSVSFSWGPRRPVRLHATDPENPPQYALPTCTWTFAHGRVWGAYGGTGGGERIECLGTSLGHWS